MDQLAKDTRENFQRGMRDYERGHSRDANPCVGVTARADWFEGYDNAKRIHEQEIREAEWMGGEAALIPEREGDTTILVCTLVRGKLVYTQRRFTAVEVIAARSFDDMARELSRMLAQLQRHRTNANRYDPEKEPRFDPNHKHDD